MKVVVLHGYSADNIGDGMLVTEALDILSTAFPSDVLDITLCASHPDTFDLPGVNVLSSMPTLLGYDRKYRKALRELDSADLVLGVGGGYLRAGTCIEYLKTALVHGPQVRAASRNGAKTVYLPQSVGPLSLGSAPLFRKLLEKLSVLWLRDDRSLTELHLEGTARRIPDMAVLRVRERTSQAVHRIPILSVRNLRGKLPLPVQQLASELRDFDGYVQSQAGSNQDLKPMQALAPRQIHSRSTLLSDQGPRRVVVAVRLHAALMALQAGHYVIHLSYERKGFAAFRDLGLSSHVHNAFSFNPQHVNDLVQNLLTDPTARLAYDETINTAIAGNDIRREDIVLSLRQASVSKESTQP